MMTEGVNRDSAAVAVVAAVVAVAVTSELPPTYVFPLHVLWFL